MNCLFEFDNNLKKGNNGLLNLNLAGFDVLVGTDEAGRGPVAGGVYAAAVCFLKDHIKGLEKLNDSKKLTEKMREELFDVITENSIYSIKCIEVQKIEEINILQSSLLAMKQAVLEVKRQLHNKKTLILIDGNRKINFELPQKTIVKGDSKSASIAAASVLAKVARDRYMRNLHLKFPEYNWAKNKGYLTHEHIEAIKKYGICDYHRKSFLKNFSRPTALNLK